MVVLVVIPGDELILGMSLIKMLKIIGPSIEPWGTPYELDIDFDMILSTVSLLNVSFHSNNFQTTCCIYLVEQVYLITNHDLHYKKLWKDREGQVKRFHFCQ